MDEPLFDEVEDLAIAQRFSGAFRIDENGALVWARAFGFAQRATDTYNSIATRFGIASGTKGFTALAVVSLIDDGTLSLDTAARTVLGSDLPLIADDVTIEHLLAHTSGIGDYIDEELLTDINEYPLRAPVQALAAIEDYVVVLDGFPTKFPAGERFSYCNGGYAVLALIAERASGTPFAQLVHERVCARAGMDDTAFLRSDELPRHTALGYLSNDGLRTNVFHLPVLGTGDGGIYSTVGDMHLFWSALFDGCIVAPKWVAEMVRPRSDAPGEDARYGLGFWVHRSRDAPILVGYDAGVSFRSTHDPEAGYTYTVVSNTSEGAWPIAKLLDERLTA